MFWDYVQSFSPYILLYCGNGSELQLNAWLIEEATGHLWDLTWLNLGMTMHPFGKNAASCAQNFCHVCTSSRYYTVLCIKHQRQTFLKGQKPSVS